MADPRDRLRNSRVGNLLVVAVVTLLVIAGVYAVNQGSATDGIDSVEFSHH